MNILYFTHEREYAGSSRALIALITELKRDNNIFVVVPFKNAKIINELKKLNVQVITCFYSWWQVPVNASNKKRLIFKLLYRFNWIAERRLLGKIKKLNVDIIHSNTSVIDIGARIAHKLSVPHIWHFREFKTNNLEFIKGDTYSYRFINKYGGNIIYISKAIEEFYSKNIDDKKTKLIYDGISQDFIIEDKKYKEKYSKINFLLAGTLQKNKGQHIAIKAVGELYKDGYKNIKLYLAGGDPVGYSSYLKELIDDYEINDCVEYIGYVDDMKKLRKDMDVELLCSESEAFGLVTVEGMLAGNPIIGSNSGATLEIIKDGETGYLYKCNDELDLKEKMKFIIDNSEYIKMIGKAGQKYAIENFMSKKNAETIMNYYKEILLK